MLIAPLLNPCTPGMLKLLLREKPILSLEEVEELVKEEMEVPKTEETIMLDHQEDSNRLAALDLAEDHLEAQHQLVEFLALLQLEEGHHPAEEELLLEAEGHQVHLAEDLLAVLEGDPREEAPGSRLPMVLLLEVQLVARLDLEEAKQTLAELLLDLEETRVGLVELLLDLEAAKEVSNRLIPAMEHPEVVTSGLVQVSWTTTLAVLGILISRLLTRQRKCRRLKKWKCNNEY